MNLVEQANLSEPKIKDCFANSIATPSNSKSIVPGLIEQLQKAILPLPLPIRTSVGLLVTGI